MSVRLTGDKELRKRLLQLDEKLRKKEVQKILKKGSTVIQREVKKTAPKRTGSGRLQGSIADLEEKRPQQYKLPFKPGTAVRIVGPRRKGKKRAAYAHIIERGGRGGRYRSPNGFVVPVSGSLARIRTISRRGTQGVRFIEKGFDAKAPQAEQAIFRYVDELVQA